MKWEVYFPSMAKSMKLKLLFTAKSCQGAFPTFDVSLFPLCPDSLCSKLWCSVPNITDFLTFVPVSLIFVLSQPFLLETATHPPKSRFYSLTGACFQRSQAELIPTDVLDTWHFTAQPHVQSWFLFIFTETSSLWLLPTKNFTPLSKDSDRWVRPRRWQTILIYIMNTNTTTQSARGDYCQIQGGPHPSNSFSFWNSWRCV